VGFCDVVFPARSADGVRILIPFLVWCLAALAATCPRAARAQTVSLPSPAESSLDRIIPTQYGAPLSPPPPSWDPYAPQASQVFPTSPAPTTWAPAQAPSAIGGQPGYPGYSTAAP
jgi:hypothetical protein